jgi:nicotinate-nucleotide pyrophosphorylase (carboxylating)
MTPGLTLNDFLRFALEEDSGSGDHTSLSTIEENATGTADVKVKQDGILSGGEIAVHILELVDKDLQAQVKVDDGMRVNSGDSVIKIQGRTRSLLKAERLLLNFMQRMSGIATLTNKYVSAVEGTGTKILDTRKTTPNFRVFEKKAVLDGGGYNHRAGLYDMILIKDNHVDAAGGIKAAIERANAYRSSMGLNLLIEIETRNIDEIKEVLASGNVDRIMLDNFLLPQLQEAVKLIDHRFETEASGGINLSTVRKFAMCGVNFISVGALTHSYHSLDISMKIRR